jgi:hypothetical protein
VIFKLAMGCAILDWENISVSNRIRHRAGPPQTLSAAANVCACARRPNCAALCKSRGRGNDLEGKRRGTMFWKGNIGGAVELKHGSELDPSFLQPVHVAQKGYYICVEKTC